MRKTRKKKRLSAINQFLLFVNVILVVSLLIAYGCSSISPADFWPAAFFGLSYPFILLLNILFILYWLLIHKNLFLLSLITIMAGFGFMGRFYQFSGNRIEDPTSVKSFKVLSFNVHNLTENNFQKLSTSQNKIFEYVLKESPDITCMQEFYSMGANYYYPLKSLKKELKADNYYFQSYYQPKKSKIVGMAIFSKLPRLTTGYLAHDSTRKFGIYADFIFNQDTIRVFNVHLESVYLGRDDYNMITGNTSIASDKNIQKRTRRIAGKMIRAFQNRASQVELIEKEIQKSPYPVILCGDFNDTPASYTYGLLADELDDSFVESGEGVGKTFSSVIPFFRIDYILHDPVFNSFNYKKESLVLSDHYPVSCYLTKDEI